MREQSSWQTTAIYIIADYIIFILLSKVNEAVSPLLVTATPGL